MSTLPDDPLERLASIGDRLRDIVEAVVMRHANGDLPSDAESTELRAASTAWLDERLAQIDHR